MVFKVTGSSGFRGLKIKTSTRKYLQFGVSALPALM